MRKVRTKKSSRKGKARLTQLGEVKRQLSLPQVLLSVKGAMLDLIVESGLQVVKALLEDDQVAVCGERSQPSDDRTAYRHGYTDGQVVLAGRKATIRRPRARGTDDKEIILSSWPVLSNEDLLSRRIVENMVIGVSTRNYHRTLDPIEDIKAHGVSKSSVSRQFVARTTKQVDEFLNQSLEELDLPIVMIDGKHFGDHLLLIALGIDRSGRKHVLGVVEGTTENETVCRSLLRDLVARGLPVERPRLFVIDGAKGLRKAIRSVFGAWGLVQRCQVHKLKNVLEHLPESKQAWVRAAILKAYEGASDSKGKSKLLALSRQLEKPHPSAARSLRDGLDETLTIVGLGVQGLLAKTLRSTNPIENLNGTLQRVARRVKRWRGGSMALRWAVTACMEAQEGFHRIKGYAELPQLLMALEANVHALDSCTKIA